MITVLVVDDDFRVARIHAAFVDRVEGFRSIGVAHSGADALRAVRTLRPDLILLSLRYGSPGRPERSYLMSDRR